MFHMKLICYIQSTIAIDVFSVCQSNITLIGGASSTLIVPGTCRIPSPMHNEACVKYFCAGIFMLMRRCWENYYVSSVLFNII